MKVRFVQNWLYCLSQAYIEVWMLQLVQYFNDWLSYYVLYNCQQSSQPMLFIVMHFERSMSKTHNFLHISDLACAPLVKELK